MAGQDGRVKIRAGFGRMGEAERFRDGGMTMKGAIFGLVVAAGVLTRGVVGAEETARLWDFERDTTGAIARGFVGEVGRWEVVEIPEGRALAQKAVNPDATFNVALVAGTSARDLDLSVRLRPVAGKEDQGGGLVWRVKDARNYYIARYNPLEENFRVYKVVDGVRTMFQDAKTPSAEGWRTVRVVMTGDHIECSLDGKKLLDVRDATFPDAGRVGLWSKSDAQTYFDDLTLRPIVAPAGVGKAVQARGRLGLPFVGLELGFSTGVASAAVWPRTVSSPFGEARA